MSHGVLYAPAVLPLANAVVRFVVAHGVALRPAPWVEFSGSSGESLQAR